MQDTFADVTVTKHEPQPEARTDNRSSAAQAAPVLAAYSTHHPVLSGIWCSLVSLPPAYAYGDHHHAAGRANHHHDHSHPGPCQAGTSIDPHAEYRSSRHGPTAPSRKTSQRKYHLV